MSLSTKHDLVFSGTVHVFKAMLEVQRHFEIRFEKWSMSPECYSRQLAMRVN